MFVRWHQINLITIPVAFIPIRGTNEISFSVTVEIANIEMPLVCSIYTTTFYLFIKIASSVTKVGLRLRRITSRRCLVDGLEVIESITV